MLTLFDPNLPELAREPYPVYAAFRDEQPVHWGVPANPALDGTWYVFSHAAAERVLIDTSTFSSDPAAVGMHETMPPGWEPVAETFQRFLGGIDPPSHTKLRRILAKAFTPSRIGALRPRLNEIRDELLVGLEATENDRFEFVADFAFPLPMTVIGEMLGVPTGDRAAFRDLSASVANSIDDPGDPNLAARGSAAITDMLAYFAALVETRRNQPADDLLTAMITAADDDGTALDEAYLLAIAIELIVAGHETTVNAVSIALLGLNDDAAARHHVATVPADRIDAVVEELLRWTSPSQRQRSRWATTDVEVAGRTIRQGQSVVVVTGAANRDPLVFREPDRILFDRPPVRHLAFGHGPHFCLGASLARLELNTVMPSLARCLNRWDLAANENIRWRSNSLLPGPLAIHATARP